MVTYSDIKAGQEALARAAQNPRQGAALQEAMAMLGDRVQMTFDFARPTGAAAQQALRNANNEATRQAALRVATLIDRGMKPAQAVDQLVRGPFGTNMSNLAGALNQAGFRQIEANAPTQALVRVAQQVQPVLGEVQRGAQQVAAQAARQVPNNPYATQALVRTQQAAAPAQRLLEANTGPSFAQAQQGAQQAAAQAQRVAGGAVDSARKALPTVRKAAPQARAAATQAQRVAPLLPVLAGGAAAAETAGLTSGLISGLSAAGSAAAAPLLALGGTALAVNELAKTQDVVEQLRYTAGPRSRNKTLGIRDVNMQSLNKNLNYYQLEKLFEEGVIDQSVLDAHRAPGTERIPDYVPPGEAPAAKEKIIFDDIEISTDRPRGGGESAGNLMMGSRGAGVQEVQRKLSALSSLSPGVNFDLGGSGADGSYGGKTKGAVEAFQRMAGIEVDGIVGPETQTALDKAMEAAISAKQAESAAREATPAAAPAAPTAAAGSEFGEGIKRVDEGVFDAAANEFEDMRIIPTKADTEPERRMPIDNVQAYEDIELDEAPRRSAFPMFRSRRNRR
tara:strand:+ start:3171 stop:4862 length:1692 start_codon:yes stop_codon:yes gene_type:complete